jgi:hypothetical protein
MVAGDPGLSKGYVPGDVYALKTELFLMAETNIQPLGRPGGSNPFIKDYRVNPSKYRRISGVAQSGTHIQIARIVFYPRPGGMMHVQAHAKVLSGPHAGQIVALSGVSNFVYDTVSKYGIAPTQDPDLLRKVD